MIGDPDRKVADLYDMIHPNASDTVTVRTVFVIGPDKKVKATLTYPQSAGRNFDEILRLVDSLQLSAKYSVSTPVNWKDGEDVIIMPSVTDDVAKDEVPEGLEGHQALPPAHAAAQQVTTDSWLERPVTARWRGALAPRPRPRCARPGRGSRGGRAGPRGSGWR